jgi:hypothetical protein
MSNASTTTITVNTGVFTAGDTLIITNIGAGVTTITAGTATVSTSASLALNQYDSGTLYFSSTGVAIWTGANIGDITGVTAGTGLTGGGTTGTVTLNLATTAKGDLVAGTGASTATALTVGNNGETLVADSSTSTGLRYQATNAAGKNCIINGGMDIFQRTSFATFNAYALDRWYIGSSQNATVTQSTAKVTPNSQYMMLMTASATQQIFAYQAIETKNAVYYAGKTVTLSGYAAGLTTTTNLNMALSYSTSTDNSVSGTWTDITASSGNPDLTLSATVTRWSATYAIPSTAKSLRVAFVNNAANITVGQGIYLGDVQLEVGSVATAFSRAGGTIQGELAAAQRYYATSIPNGYTITDFPVIGTGTPGIAFYATGSNDAFGSWQLPVEMRTTPTTNIYSSSNRTSGSVRSATTGTDYTCSGYGFSTGNRKGSIYLSGFGAGVTSGLVLTAQWTASAEL